MPHSASIQFLPSFSMPHQWALTSRAEGIEVEASCDGTSMSAMLQPMIADGVPNLLSDDARTLEVEADHGVLDGTTVWFDVKLEKMSIQRRYRHPLARFFPRAAAVLRWLWTELYARAEDPYRLHLEDLQFEEWGPCYRRTPTGLRFFSLLNSDSAPALQKALADLEPRSGPVMDMRNCIAIAPVLFPMVQKFLGEHPDARWEVTADRMHDSLRQAGVPASHIIRCPAGHVRRRPDQLVV